MRRRALAGLGLFGHTAAVRADDFELSPIKAIELRASRLADVVSLAQGIPSFDTPEPIKRYAAEKIAQGKCAKYSLTPGLPELRELVSEALLRDGMPYDPDGEIIVTCGAIEAVSATLLALVEPGDEVLLASPTYASYLGAVRLAGAQARFVALKEDANFDLDPEAIGAAISRRTRAILLSNPNNPTGTVYSEAETARMMELAARHGLLVISDDVYKDFIYTSEPPGNPARLSEHRGRVVRVCSFSKAYGMTGWRVGFLHTARPLAERILRVHDALVTCAPVVSQYAAIAALEVGDPFVEQFRAAFRQRRARVIDRLDALPEVFDYQKPNASYFAFPRIKDTVPLARDSRALADDILERARVALVPGVAFGPTGESHLRFCYARELADIDLAFDRLSDYFRGRTPRTAAPALPPPILGRADRVRSAGVSVLHALARMRLARQRPRVVAIAGGRGKTVLKRLLAELLGAALRVRSNPLSYNTEIGIAFAVLDTDFDPRLPVSVVRGLARAAWHTVRPDAIDALVLEFGTRHRGDIAKLLRVARPDIAVVMPLTPSFADDQDALAAMQAEVHTLIDATHRAGGAVAVCADDPVLATLAEPVHPQWFRKADHEERNGQQWVRAAGTDYPLGREVVGDSSLYALIASVIIARHLGVPEHTIRTFLSSEPAR
jgi:aminotransferase